MLVDLPRMGARAIMRDARSTSGLHAALTVVGVAAGVISALVGLYTVGFFGLVLDENRASPLPSNAVARVGTVLIDQETFDRWFAIATRVYATPKSDPTSTQRHLTNQVMQFLILAQWVEQQASQRGLSANDHEVDVAFKREKHKTFRTNADFARFERDAGMRLQDARYQVQFNLDYTRLRTDAARGALTRQDRQRADDPFNRTLREKWTPHTVCAHG